MSIELLIVAASYLPKCFISVSIEKLLAESTGKRQLKWSNSEVVYYSDAEGNPEMDHLRGSQSQWPRRPLKTQVLSIAALAFSALQDGRLQSR